MSIKKTPSPPSASPSGSIRPLPSALSALLLSYQVIPNPLILLKSLVENSIDANSSSIAIGIARASGSYIYTVEDDGDGMEETSSILKELCTSSSPGSYGYRGASLHAISTLSSVVINTKVSSAVASTVITKDKTYLSVRDGKGTTVTVSNLFYNLPIRSKCTNSNINSYIASLIAMATSYIVIHNVQIKITKDGNTIFGYDQSISSGILRLLYLTKCSRYNRVVSYRSKNLDLVTVIIDNCSKKAGVISINNRVVTNRRVDGVISGIANAYYLQVSNYAVEREGRGGGDSVLIYREEMLVREIKEMLESGGVGEKNAAGGERKINYRSESSALEVEHVECISKNGGGREREREREREKERPRERIRNLLSPLPLPSSPSPSPSPPLLTPSTLSGLEVIGQFNDSFIITRHLNSFYIIDQHSSDEVVKYHHLLNNYYLKTQLLIKPIRLNLSDSDKYVAASNACIIERNGFRVSEDLSEIREIPYYGREVFGIAELHEVIEGIREGKERVMFLKFKKIIASKACRSAVMIGDKLSHREMSSIVGNLSRVSNPFNCPHGRPTIKLLMERVTE